MPLPWSLTVKHKGYSLGIDGADGSAVVWVSESRGEGIKHDYDAAYIVKAANAYPELVEAIKDTLRAADNGEPYTRDELYSVFMPIIEKAGA